MIDLGKLAYFLGKKLLDTSMEVILHQAKYTNEIMTKFSMLENKSTITPIDTNLKFGGSYTGEEDKVDAIMLRQLITKILMPK